MTLDLSASGLELLRTAVRESICYLSPDFFIDGVRATAVEAEQVRDLLCRGLLVQHGPIIQATAVARHAASVR